MRGLTSILYLLRNSFNKCKIKGARMLDFFYHVTLEGDIGGVSIILTSGNWFELDVILYYPVCQFRPVFR